MIEWLKKQPSMVRLWSTRYLHLFAISREHAHPSGHDTVFRRNHWPDLEAFEQTERWLPRSGFLATARERLDKGEDVYTLVEGGRLICYGWLRRHCQQSRYTYVDQTVIFAPGTAVIYNGWVHPEARGRRLHRAAQLQRIADAFTDPDGCYVFSAVEAANTAAYKSASRAGLHPQAVLETRTRFGRQRKSASRSPTAYPFEVQLEQAGSAASAEARQAHA